MTDTKRPVDWERIELDYRAGVLSLREIAETHNTNHMAITRKAKKEGWTRDLSEKIKAKADSIVTRSCASGVTAERDVIESGAQAIANIRLAHRGDINRFRKLSIKLLDELEHQTENQDLYQQMGELLRAETDNGMDKLNDLYNRVISTPSRIDSNKKLAETLRHLIALEREAYNIDSNTREEKTIIATESVSSEDAARIYMDMIHGRK